MKRTPCLLAASTVSLTLLAGCPKQKAQNGPNVGNEKEMQKEMMMKMKAKGQGGGSEKQQMKQERRGGKGQ